jgi:hypothetical protein
VGVENELDDRLWDEQFWEDRDGQPSYQEQAVCD